MSQSQRSQESATAPWHYVDLPVCKLSDPSGCLPPEPINAVWAIEQSEATLSNSSGSLDKERMLRFMVHIIGDVHQPLHAAQYFSAQFPSGDRGGNSWKIAGVPYATELHAMWDEGLGQWTQNLKRPWNATGQKWVGNLAAKVMGLYPVASMGAFIANRNVSAWAEESFGIAEAFVYTAPQAPTRVPAAYTTQGQAIALKQLAIAGYRLAAALELVLTSPKDAVYTRVHAL